MAWLCFLLLLAPAQEKKTGKAARINDEIITWDEIYAKFKTFKPQDITDDLLRAELRQQAEERLMLQEARRLKISVTEREIDEAVERLVRSFGGKDKLDQYLRWKKMTATEHRELRRKELIELKLYRQLIRGGIQGQYMLLVEMISPEEIREYYNGHRENFKAIQHCTVLRIGLQYRTPEEKDHKRRVAESLRRRIEEGTDLLLVAQFHSDIRTTTDDGRTEFVIRELRRDNTFFSAETTKYLFETLNPQTTSPVVEDGTTFNLFYILDRVNKPEESFEDAQIKIRNELEHKKRDQNRQELLKQLLKRAYVEPTDLFK